MSGPASDAPDPATKIGQLPPARLVYTRLGPKSIFVIACALFGLVFLSGIFAPTTTWWEKLLLGLAVACLAVLAVRVGGLAVVAERDELVIRNLRNTHRIPWSQIDQITAPGPIPASVYRENPLAHQNRQLQVVLHDDAVISATVYDERMFSVAWWQGAQKRQSAIAQVNQVRFERS